MTNQKPVVITQKTSFMGKRYSILLFIVCFVQSLVGFAQSETSTNFQQSNFVRVKVVSSPNDSPVAFANVLIPRTQNGTTTDVNGTFYLRVLPTDKIVVSAIGYMTDTVSVQRYFILNQHSFTISLKRKQYLLEEVIVEEEGMDLGIGTKNDIPMQIRSESFNDGPSVLGAIVSPLSTARYFFSKEEKQRKRAREIFHHERKWGTFYDRVTPERIKRQTGASDEQYERFMPYFNINHKLTPHASERDIEEAIAFLWSAWLEQESNREKENQKNKKRR